MRDSLDTHTAPQTLPSTNARTSSPIGLAMPTSGVRDHGCRRRPVPRSQAMPKFYGGGGQHETSSRLLQGARPWPDKRPRSQCNIEACSVRPKFESACAAVQPHRLRPRPSAAMVEMPLGVRPARRIQGRGPVSNSGNWLLGVKDARENESGPATSRRSLTSWPKTCGSCTPHRGKQRRRRLTEFSEAALALAASVAREI